MKTRWIILAYLIGALTFGVWGYADTITKGLIGKEDIDLTQTDNSTTETFNRATSTGATIALTKLEGNHIPWSSLYTRTIRPKTITGNSSGAISGYTTITAATTLASSGNLTVATTSTLTGNVGVGGTLGVTGAATFTSSVTSDSLTTGAGTFSGDVTANGNIVGDSGTTITGMAQIDIDGKSFDTATAVPSAGTWVAGDFVFNSAPTALTTIAATGAIGWQCVTGGTPGTWRAIFPTFTATPDNAAMTCTAGMTAIDASYWYVCQAANTWLRVAIATW